MGGNLKDFWEWNQASNTWTQKTNFGGVARHLAVGFSIGNKGYIGTGDSGPGCDDANKVENSDFWEYTPDSTGCAATAIISSDPSPSTTLCVGQSAYITASGGTSYVWNTGSTTAFMVANPTITTTYSVTVTDANGCTGTASITFIVDPNCASTGISQINSDALQAEVWPNPSIGEFRIGDLGLGIYNLDLYNVFGEKVYADKILNPESQIFSLDLPDGVYFMQISAIGGEGNSAINKKIIIQK
ncbi:MAG: T9SS type A sorting domain-containing protein [Bacteroidetes bacterium]|nr:MAG: T9SS type A sorting domain-containing protein [Bacteroidota bacterium]